MPESEGGGGPNVNKVVIRSIPDNTSRVAALTGGELSAADGLTPDDVPTVKQARASRWSSGRRSRSGTWR